MTSDMGPTGLLEVAMARAERARAVFLTEVEAVCSALAAALQEGGAASVSAAPSCTRRQRPLTHASSTGGSTAGTAASPTMYAAASFHAAAHEALALHASAAESLRLLQSLRPPRPAQSTSPAAQLAVGPLGAVAPRAVCSPAGSFLHDVLARPELGVHLGMECLRGLSLVAIWRLRWV